MPENQIREIIQRFDTFTKEFHGFTREISEIKGALKNIKTHDAPCKFLETLQTKQSGDIKDLHNKFEDHFKDCHSSRNARANWAAIAAIICALATVVGVIYK